MFEDELTSKFERTYGWSWLLKLQEELRRSPLDKAKSWSESLAPLADNLVEKYKKFMTTLAYPVRVGTHTNTAFGLIYPLEFDAYGKRNYLVVHVQIMTFVALFSVI